MAFCMLTSLRAITGSRPEKHRFLLAVSGGLDSVVLAHTFKENGLTFGIAHCNFQLRGKDSDEDEAFVRQLAVQWGATFFSQRFDTLSVADHTGDSIQMTARKLRYDWLEDVRAAQDYDWIVTAHHLDDALETFFINFLRGSGLRGLTGIPQRNGKIIRPFLTCTREALEQVYHQKNLSHREDVSNAETTYLRNKIRHLLLPLLHQIEPGILNRTAQNLAALRDTLQIYDYTIHAVRDTILDREGPRVYLKWPELESLPAPETILLELLSPYGFNETQCRKAWQIRKGQPGRIFETRHYMLVLDRKRFVLEPRSEQESPHMYIQDTETEIHFPGGRLDFQIRHIPRVSIPGQSEIIQVQLRKLQFPIILRKWQPGDRFCPSGMGGKHKKVQDLLTDLHMDRLRKSQVWVLENGNGDIIWVIGLRQDERYRIYSHSTDSCMEIRFFQTEFS